MIHSEITAGLALEEAFLRELAAHNGRYGAKYTCAATDRRAELMRNTITLIETLVKRVEQLETLAHVHRWRRFTAGSLAGSFSSPRGELGSHEEHSRIRRYR